MKTIKKIPMKEKKKIIEAILITLMLMMIVKHRLSQAHTLQLGHRVTEPLLEADEQELPPPPKHRLSSHGLLSPAPSRRGSMRKDEKVSILSYEIPLSSNSSYGQAVLNGGNEPRLVSVAVEQLKTVSFYHPFWNRTTKPSLVFIMFLFSPSVAPPSPYGPMNQSVSTASASPSKAKPASEKVSPYLNTAYRKSSKLAALEASGSNNYVLGTSPSVGKFQRSRTVKEKKQGPTCKEGDAIKEGQMIAYLHQLGKELHVTIIHAQTNSDVAGEVLKLLSDVGGYGEPLVAVLPSFHDINIQ